VTQSPQGRTNEDGFTLFEVLVAFAIAALMLTAFMRTFSLGFSTLERARDNIDATLIAESTLDAVGTAIPLRDADRADRVGRYARRIVIQEVDTRPGNASAGNPTAGTVVRGFRVVVTVQWPQDRPTRSVRLETLRLAPWQ